MSDLRFMIDNIRKMEQVAGAWGPVHISGMEVGPVLLSKGGGLFLLEIRPGKGQVKIVHHGARPVLSLSGHPFLGGDPVKNLIKKMFLLKENLVSNIGYQCSIQPVLVFPDAYLDFFYKKRLSPVGVNAIRLWFLGEYLKRMDMDRPPWQSIPPEEQGKIGEFLLANGAC